MIEFTAAQLLCSGILMFGSGLWLGVCLAEKESTLISPEPQPQPKPMTKLFELNKIKKTKEVI